MHLHAYPCKYKCKYMCVCHREFNLAPQESGLCSWLLGGDLCLPGGLGLARWQQGDWRQGWSSQKAQQCDLGRWLGVMRYQLTRPTIWAIDQSASQSCRCNGAPVNALNTGLWWASLVSDALCILSHRHVRRVTCPWPQGEKTTEAPCLTLLMDSTLPTSMLGWF